MSDSGSEIGAFMAGFVIGGLVGAATALIMAPQSGEETRAQIATKSHELRDAGAHQYEAARVRVHDTTGQVQEQARIVLDEGKSKMSSGREGTATDGQEVDAAPDVGAAGEDAAA
ncbi:MAG: YtxH domain-containing protein [Chloroflexota bacterium]|nr:MAG: YtxH domain-containing protein [Chloroflexota bacterium]